MCATFTAYYTLPNTSGFTLPNSYVVSFSQDACWCINGMIGTQTNHSQRSGQFQITAHNCKLLCLIEHLFANTVHTAGRCFLDHGSCAAFCHDHLWFFRTPLAMTPCGFLRCYFYFRCLHLVSEMSVRWFSLHLTMLFAMTPCGFLRDFP